MRYSTSGLSSPDLLDLDLPRSSKYLQHQYPTGTSHHTQRKTGKECVKTKCTARFICLRESRKAKQSRWHHQKSAAMAKRAIAIGNNSGMRAVQPQCNTDFATQFKRRRNDNNNTTNKCKTMSEPQLEGCSLDSVRGSPSR